MGVVRVGGLAPGGVVRVVGVEVVPAAVARRRAERGPRAGSPPRWVRGTVGSVPSPAPTVRSGSMVPGGAAGTGGTATSPWWRRRREVSSTTPATSRNRPIRAATTASTNHDLSVTVMVSELSWPPSVFTTRVSGAPDCCTVSVTGPFASSCWRHRSAAPSSGAVPVPVVVVSSDQSLTDTPVTATCFVPPTTAFASEGLASAIHTEPPVGRGRGDDDVGVDPVQHVGADDARGRSWRGARRTRRFPTCPAGWRTRRRRR